LADEDDVDAAGQLLVDLEDLPDLAVLPVSGHRSASTLRPCSSSATTAAFSACSSGSSVKRPGVVVVLIGWSFVGDGRTLERKRTLPRFYSGHKAKPMSQPVTQGPPHAERAAL
jgi:hypothetical protein